MARAALFLLARIRRVIWISRGDPSHGQLPARD
jgi:hypothetical protein